MKQQNFKKTVYLLAFALISACSGEGSKSPDFAPGTLLTIQGTYLDVDGSPLSNQPIQLQNLRRFAYFDYTEAVIEELTNAFMMAFYLPFFPFFKYDAPPSQSYKKPNYLIEEVKTGSNGEFSFQIVADKFVRDSEGGININLTNVELTPTAFGRSAFVVKGRNTDLGNVSLCNPEMTVTEDGVGNVRFSWSAIDQEVKKYVLNFGLDSDGSLVWSQQVEGDQIDVTLPALIFDQRAMKVAMEVFLTDEDEKKISCLAPPTKFSLTTASTSLISGALATSNYMDFKLDSLTNSLYRDPLYLGAFHTRAINFVFDEAVTFEKVVFHNLLLGSTDPIILKITPENGSDVKEYSIDPLRFLVFDLGESITAVKLTIETTSDLMDLKEFSVY